MQFRIAPLALFLILFGVGGGVARAETAQAKLRVKIVLAYTAFADANDSFSEGVRISNKDVIRMIKGQNPGAKKVELVSIRDTSDLSSDLANERALVLLDGKPLKSLFLSTPFPGFPTAEAVKGKLQSGAFLFRQRAGVAAVNLTINYDNTGRGPLVGTVVGVDFSSTKRKTVGDLLLFGKRSQDLFGSVKQPVGGDLIDAVLIGNLSAGREKVVPALDVPPVPEP